MSIGLRISCNTIIHWCDNAAKFLILNNVDIYKRYHNIYNSTIRASKKLLYCTVWKKIAVQSFLKKSWQIRKQATNLSSKISEKMLCFLLDGISISGSSLIANHWNRFLENIPPDIIGKIHSSNEQVTDQQEVAGHAVPTLNSKLGGYINWGCCAAGSHIWLLRQPIGEREFLSHATSVVGSSATSLRKS